MEKKLTHSFVKLLIYKSLSYNKENQHVIVFTYKSLRTWATDCHKETKVLYSIITKIYIQS